MSSLSAELDLLGAEGLSGQFITLRIKSIDKAKLSQALGGVKGAAVPAALAVVDIAPKQALELAMPLVAAKAMKEYGVELDYQVGEAPPKPGENPAPRSGGAAKGVVLGVLLGGVGAYAAHRYGLVDKAGGLLSAARSKVGL